MKLFHTLLVLSFVITTLSFAESKAKEAHILYDKDAVISLAQPDLAGSHNSIEIDGKSYLIDPVSLEAGKQFTMIKNAHTFHKDYETEPGVVVGFIVKEKGHFPNPSAEFKVFKAMTLNFAIPRVIRPLRDRDED